MDATAISPCPHFPFRQDGLRAQIPSRCHGGGAATAPLFIAFPGNVCPKGNVVTVHEKGRLIPAIIEPANSLHRLFHPFLWTNWPLTAVVRRSPVRSGRFPWRSLQGSVTNRAGSRSRSIAKYEVGMSKDIAKRLGRSPNPCGTARGRWGSLAGSSRHRRASGLAPDGQSNHPFRVKLCSRPCASLVRISATAGVDPADEHIPDPSQRPYPARSAPKVSTGYGGCACRPHPADLRTRRCWIMGSARRITDGEHRRARRPSGALHRPVTLEGGYLIPMHGHNDASSVVVQTIGVPGIVKPLAPGGHESAGRRISVSEPRSAAGGRDLCHVGGASELPQQGVPFR